jgi:hypothetical protein
MALMWRPDRSLLALALALPALAFANGNIFCCQAANGQPICGDVLPQVCFGKEYREISPRGTVLRVVAAPPTEGERARLAERKRLQALEEEAREKQRRIDTALLETYRSQADIDAREASSLADIDGVIRDIRQRLTELDEEQQRLDSLLASLKPEQITQRHRLARDDIDSERATYQRLLDNKFRERDAVVLRYAADRRRFAEIESGETASPGPSR